jgi:hypothetical protein
LVDKVTQWNGEARFGADQDRGGSGERGLAHLAAKPSWVGAWLQQMLARSHPNVVVVALAGKLARVAWAVLRHDENFYQEAIMRA